MPAPSERPTLREQLAAVSTAVHAATQSPLTIALHGPRALELVLELQTDMVAAIERLAFTVGIELVVGGLQAPELEHVAHELRAAHRERRES
jgi:hypothetical protein